MKYKEEGLRFQDLYIKAWIQDYNQKTGEKVNYAPTGSGDGVKSIKKRMVDFGGTDKPMNTKILVKNKLFMFPTVVGREGKYILPTLKSFQDAAKEATWTPENDFYALIA